MRFYKGIPRIIDMLRPGTLVDRSYMWARWRSRRYGGAYWYSERSPWKAGKRQTGGWLPGRHRLAGLRPMRHIIEPAVRYMPVTRQYNEIVERRWKNKEFVYPWDRRKPSHLKRSGNRK